NLSLAFHLVDRGAVPVRIGIPALVLVALLAGQTAEQAKRAVDVRHRLDANYNVYGWRIGAWFEAGLPGQEDRYTEALARRFEQQGGQERLRIAATHANAWRRLRRDLEYAVVNQTLDLRHIGAVVEGLEIPGWPDSQMVGSTTGLTGA